MNRPVRNGRRNDRQTPGSFALRFADALCDEELERQNDIWRPFTEDALTIAHDENRAVNVFKIDTWYQAEQLANAGVDGLIANYITLFVF